MTHESLIKTFMKKHRLTFKNPRLLERALTHSSYVNELKESNVKDNERLEFLGDAVLELAISRYLFLKLPNAEEGELSKLRAQYVCEAALAVYANSIDLGDYLRLGKGEEQSGGRARPAILADAFEATLGAIFLDQGYQAAYTFLESVVFTQLDTGQVIGHQDFKSRLQELVQADSKRAIQYRTVSESGPAHRRQFTVEVYMDTILMGKGTGRSKKEAEQHAAKAALEKVANPNLNDA